MEHLLSARARAHQASAIRELLRLTEQPDMLSLAGGLPAPDGFPVALLRDALDAAMTGHAGATGPVALQYAPTEGVAVLREQVAAEHGMPVEQVLITTGSQQALDLLARVLCDPGDVVLAEDPSYLGALQALRFAGADVVGVPGDADGIDTVALAEALARHSGRVKAVYVVPNFHNPTGSTLAAGRRERVLELADRHGVVVIEDDPYGTIRFVSEELPALGGPGQPVARLGSASKVIAPGLRVGWMSGPAPIVAAAVRAKQAADLHTSSLSQVVVAEVLRDERYAAHIGRLREIYAERTTALAAGLRRHLGDAVAFDVPRGGMFIWATLSAESLGAAETTDELLRLALDEKVAFVPGSGFAVDPASGAHRHSMRLSYATLTPDRLDEACRRLARALDRCGAATMAG